MMRFPFCPYEEKVAGMLLKDCRQQGVETELRAHAGKCPRCGEILFAAEMLRTGRAASMIAAPTTSPGYLWWRAQLRRQAIIVERMTKPIAWAEKLALAGMLALVAGLGFWQRALLLDLFRSFIGISVLAGLSLVLCVGGLALLLSDETH